MPLDPQLTEQMSATELEEGDVILDRGLLLRIVGEPHTVHTGLGLFDDFSLMIRADLEYIDNGRRVVAVWPLNATLHRVRTADPDDPAKATRRRGAHPSRD